MDFWMVAAFAALIVCAVLGLLLLRNGNANTAGNTQSVELARVQEREQRLNQDLARERDALQSVTVQLTTLQLDHSEAREHLAAAEARIDGLQKALTDEKLGAAEITSSLTAELKAVKSNFDGLQKSYIEASQQLSASGQMEKELRERITRDKAYIGERDDENRKLESHLEELRARVGASEQDLAAFRERETALKKTISERDEQLKGLQEKLKTEFENIANHLLKDASDQLSKKSQESLASVLTPLQDRIKEFKETIESSHKEDVKDRSALNTEIRLLSEKNQTLGNQAETLAKALKGDSALRGRWGEIRLERILEMSGLERDREYVVQGGEFNIKSEEGRNQRPDVIVLLPEKRHLIIDSKVSLVSYLEHEKADSEETRNSALRDLKLSCRRHIDDLSGKAYQYGDAINSHDLVLMFMPEEGVAALALKNDDGLFEYAWNRKIVIVSPGSLFLAMQTVSSIWRYERQNRNAKEIADQAAQLYDKLVGVVTDLNNVSQKIRAAATAHDEAMKKLSTGKGNAISQAERLKDLGVSPKKSLPLIQIEGQRRTADEDEIEEA